jgi:hypothetical protein
MKQARCVCSLHEIQSCNGFYSLGRKPQTTQDLLGPRSQKGLPTPLSERKCKPRPSKEESQRDKIGKTLSQKQNANKGVDGMVQMVEYLPRKSKAPSSNPCVAKKKKKRGMQGLYQRSCNCAKKRWEQ